MNPIMLANGCNLEKIENIADSIFILQDQQTKKKYLQQIIKSHDNNFEKKKEILLHQMTIIENHPSIMQIRGVDLNSIDSSISKSPSIITEYMEKGSLQKYFDELEAGKISELSNTQKLIILLGIAHGIEHFDLNDLIDFELKPSKIILDDNFYPHICFNHFSNQLMLVYDRIEYNHNIRKKFAHIAYELFTGKKPNMQEEEEICKQFIIILEFQLIKQNQSSILKKQWKKDLFYQCTIMDL